MSLVTRCPACATTFKVVRDQLRISDGWVRCGRCSEVFDAMLDLQESADAPSPTPPPAAEADAPAPDPEAHRAAPEAEAQQSGIPAFESRMVSFAASAPEPGVHELAEADFLDDEHEAGLDHSLVTGEELASAAGHDGHEQKQELEPDAADDEDDNGASDSQLAAVLSQASWPEAEALLLGEHGRRAVRPPPPPPLSFPAIELASPALRALEPSRDDAVQTDAAAFVDDGGNAQLTKALRRARAKSAKIAKARARELKAATSEIAPLPTHASESDAPPPAAAASPVFAELPPPFTLPDDEASRWQRPWVRRSLWGVAVLAGLLLVAQVIHQQRDLIAARQPSLRPMLTSMCGLLGCEVSALRQINDIKIDGASFAREKTGDGFQLSFTLRNGANVPLAMPAVEVSLLDTQERAVVRRVLMPAEFGAPPVLPARAERNASLSLNLSGAEVALLPPVVGFRLEALYP